MSDPRIDPLPKSAVITDTAYRIAFAPADAEAKVTAYEASTPNTGLLNMQKSMLAGRVHIQIKAPFVEERVLELSGPELFVLMEMADRFVTQLPRAQQASTQGE